MHERAKQADIVRGYPSNYWMSAVDELTKAKAWERLDPLLAELIAASELSDDLSLLPPSSYWHEKACTAYQRRGWLDMAAHVLERWLALPDTDLVPGRTRRITWRLERIRNRQLAQRLKEQ